MIRINLLPVKQIRRRLQARKEVMAFVAALAALAVVLVIVSLGLVSRVDDLKASVKDLELEKKKYQQTLDQIAKLQKDQAELEAKLTTIRKLKQGSQLAVRVMDEVAKLTPPESVWLNSFNFSGNILRISGIGLDDATIANYMRAITGSPYFASAELSGTSQTNYQGSKLKSFSLTCAVVNPQLQKAEEAESAQE